MNSFCLRFAVGLLVVFQGTLVAMEQPNNNNLEDTALFDAARKGDLDAIKRLVEQKKVDIKAKYNQGATALHVAAQEGRLEVVKYLVVQGASIEAKSDKGFTALHMALMKGQLEVIKYLVDQGASIKAKSDDGTAALHVAVLAGQLEVVKYLIGQGASIEAKNNKGFTALHAAAETGQLEAVKYLVGQGADGNAVSKTGWSVLTLAAGGGCFGVVKHLVSEGFSFGGSQVLAVSAIFFILCASFKCEEAQKKGDKELALSIISSIDSDPAAFVPLLIRANLTEFLVKALQKHEDVREKFVKAFAGDCDSDIYSEKSVDRCMTTIAQNCPCLWQKVTAEGLAKSPKSFKRWEQKRLAIAFKRLLQDKAGEPKHDVAFQV